MLGSGTIESIDRQVDYSVQTWHRVQVRIELPVPPITIDYPMAQVLSADCISQCQTLRDIPQIYRIDNALV